QIAQLAGFIDQAGLFRTFGAVTNKLHIITPYRVFSNGFSWDLRAISVTSDASWNSGRGNSTADWLWPASYLTLILRRPRGGVPEGCGHSRACMVRDGALRLLTIRNGLKRHELERIPVALDVAGIEMP